MRGVSEEREKEGWNLPLGGDGRRGERKSGKEKAEKATGRREGKG